MDSLEILFEEGGNWIITSLPRQVILAIFLNGKMGNVPIIAVRLFFPNSDTKIIYDFKMKAWRLGV